VPLAQRLLCRPRALRLLVCRRRPWRYRSKPDRATHPMSYLAAHPTTPLDSPLVHESQSFRSEAVRFVTHSHVCDTRRWKRADAQQFARALLHLGPPRAAHLLVRAALRSGGVALGGVAATAEAVRARALACAATPIPAVPRAARSCRLSAAAQTATRGGRRARPCRAPCAGQRRGPARERARRLCGVAAFTQIWRKSLWLLRGFAGRVSSPPHRPPPSVPHADLFQ